MTIEPYKDVNGTVTISDVSLLSDVSSCNGSSVVFTTIINGLSSKPVLSANFIPSFWYAVGLKFCHSV